MNKENETWILSPPWLLDRIEKNADLTLWCVHVLGPDDMYAAPSHADAVQKANQLNADFQSDFRFADILCFAYAAPWPHSKAEHERRVKNWEAE